MLEDTDLSVVDLEISFLKRVTQLIQALTKPMVLPNETHRDRNQRFIKQIENAGETAMFLKVCESMHEMKAPAKTPIKLMRKSVNKARRRYVKFFDKNLLSSVVMEAEYNFLINEATKCVLKYENKSEVGTMLNINEVIEKMVLSSELKSLELHDILEIIEALSHSSILLIREESSVIDQVFLDSEIFDIKTKLSFLKKIKDGSLCLSEIPNEYKKSLLPGVNFFFFIPLNLDDRSSVLILGYKEKPDWVSFYSLKMFIVFLMSKARENKEQKLREISTYASFLGFNLTLNELIKTNSNELKYLSDLLRTAESLKGIVERELMHFLIDSDFKSEAFQSRLKSPNSVLQKKPLRNYNNLSEIDDIIGFRFTSISKLQQSILAKLIGDFFSKHLPGISPFNIKVRDSGSPLIYVQSSAGYKALHLCYWLSFGGNSLPISCEVQIRTFFQNAWGEVSHAVLNKNDSERDDYKTTLDALDELSELCDKADSIMDRLD